MKNSTQQARLQTLADSINKSSTDPPVQMVVPAPLEQPDVLFTKSESQLNVEIQTAIIDRLKFHGIKTRKSLKQLVAEALVNFLDKAEGVE